MNGAVRSIAQPGEPSASIIGPVLFGLRKMWEAAVPQGVQVVFGDPGEYVPAGLVVIQSWHLDQPPAGLGNGLPWKVEQIGEVHGLIRTANRGDNGQAQEAAMLDAFEINDAMQAALRNDPRLGGVLTGGNPFYSYIATTDGDLGIPDSTGRACQIDLVYFFRGRIGSPPSPFVPSLYQP